MKRLAVLGSTGSIGVQTLDIAESFSERFQIVALGAGRNIDLLKEQIEQFRPHTVSVFSEALAQKLANQLSAPPEIVHGIEGLIQVATLDEVDMVISALVGAVGLVPTLSAVKAKKNIALANKESLVMGGKIVMEEARRMGVDILPIDSEHCAIFQSMVGHHREDVHRIILTASGGPFLHYPMEKLENVTPQEALRHPRWEMGKKVTIDSATLMNKGLEIIEAHWLFNIPVERIDVQIHPQSVVHSMVEYTDGSIVAQMGITDMRIPISYALSYPERLTLQLPPLDLCEIGELTFFRPDRSRFPALELATHAITIGETMPAVLNAANELAVNAYLRGALKFIEIPRIVEATMDAHKIQSVQTVDDVLKADHWARETAREFLERDR
ncbi:MAG: 1-deoxy-D-xylulose-5-phosphate reductoisomerase [Proteobacteria bacterium]|nr:1-deoxy-D-xylulose-5-phosphate reductoisomerase [Pseudomonadota bacterium]NIS69533.1 1-deoxy-D-xylulose-5-phosphate reductoisomerase [Pseudomonadota bacterium]